MRAGASEPNVVIFSAVRGAIADMMSVDPRYFSEMSVTRTPKSVSVVKNCALFQKCSFSEITDSRFMTSDGEPYHNLNVLIVPITSHTKQVAQSQQNSHIRCDIRCGRA